MSFQDKPEQEESIESQLLEAIENNNLEEVKELCKQGVDDFRFFCDFGYSIVEYAVENGNLEIVKTLIVNGANINDGLSNSPVELAVQTNRMDILLTLLEARVDVNQELVGGYNGWTLLMSAANSGHLDIVKLLIQRGASVNVTTEEG